MTKYLVLLLLLPCVLWAAPDPTGYTGTLTHGSSVTITGSSFGTKSTATPVAWDNFSQDSVGSAPTSTATMGSWTNVGWDSATGVTPFTVSTAVQRFSGSRSVYANMNREMRACFAGGSDSQTWFVQYWFYLGPGFAFNSSNMSSLGNIKFFRMWSTGSDTANVRVSADGTYDVAVTCESIGGSENWNPVISGYKYIDQVMGYSDPGYVDPTCTGWKHFENDVTTGSWHLFQFEYKDSSVGGSDGVIRWWFDGKLILNRSDFRTRDSSNQSFKRPQTVGFYNSHSADGSSAAFYMSDVYIDNTWARVEIGDASTYAACTHKEIQPATAWTDNADPTSDSITVTLNQGSFADESTAYVYVVDSTGAVNANGYEITFGSSGSPALQPTMQGCSLQGGGN